MTDKTQDRRNDDRTTKKRLSLISVEFFAIFLMLVAQSGSAIWWAATMTSRVNYIEAKVDGGDIYKNGAVQEVKIKMLSDLAVAQSDVNKSIESRLSIIQRDVAVLKARGR